MYAFIVLCFIPLISGFNIDTNYTIVYGGFTNISNKTSYFGYSLALYPGKNDNRSWIFIGAPRGENSKLKFRNPGVFFKCEIKKLCAEVDVSKSQIYPSQGYKPEKYQQLLNDSWIGGSMDINYKYDSVAICAHRWIHNNTYSKDYYTHGACYWFQINQENSLQTLLPLTSSGQDVYKKSVYLYGQGQAGASVHMPSAKAEVLMGAPGVYNWDGTSIIYKYDTLGKFISLNVADPLSQSETVAFDLLGYSSTSGYFYGKKNLFYVSGAPRSENYLGKVLIYKFIERNKKPVIRTSDKISGKDFGEYFGASLASGDLNNDGYDDLIVGAPFNSPADMKYNEGKVYIFMGGRNKLSDSTSMTGNSANGQFGACVQYLGDINADGYGDLAVSAPYEDDNHGVVYVYRGSSLGINTNHYQKILGRNILPEIRGFGISISRTADIDRNESPDVAVGAYLSGHVAILRTYPVVTIHHNMSLPMQLDVSGKKIEISVCFWCRLNGHIPSVAIRRILRIDEQLGRAKLENAEPVEELQLLPNQTLCKSYNVSYKPLNLVQSLTVSLAHEFLDMRGDGKEVVFVSKNGVRGTDSFCSNCPVYDGLKSTPTITEHISFALNCGEDKICTSSLEFEPQFTDIDDDGVFVVGSSNTLTLETLIKNNGENAYSTKIVFQLPESVGVQTTPNNCEEDSSSSVICDVGNPLTNNATHTVMIKLDMTNVNKGNLDDVLQFTVTVKTSSVNRFSDTKSLNITLKRDAIVNITGKSKEEFYLYNAEEDVKFTQTYWVRTFGVSILDELYVELDLPHFIKATDNSLLDILQLHPIKAKLDTEAFRCKSDFKYLVDANKDESQLGDAFLNVETGKERKKRSPPSEEKNIQKNVHDVPSNRTFYINCSNPQVVCAQISCSVKSIKPGQVAKLEMSMLLNISLVKNFLKKNHVILFATRGNVRVTRPSHFDQNGYVVEVTSLLIGGNVKEMIPLWIILLSVVCGLLLLLLVILGLIKAGFFKRKTKEELDQLKKEMEFLEQPSEDELRN